jgi:rhodanese-related sulfurtransferase
VERLLDYIGNHPWLVGLLVLAVLLIVAYEMHARRTSFASISPQEAIRLMNQGALVLDIRQITDFKAGHLAGAKHMPSDQILKAGETLKKHKEKPILVYDESGSLGAAAVRQLIEQGFTKAFTLRGGLQAWRAENLPLTKG